MPLHSLVNVYSCCQIFEKDKFCLFLNTFLQPWWKTSWGWAEMWRRVQVDSGKDTWRAWLHFEILRWFKCCCCNELWDCINSFPLVKDVPVFFLPSVNRVTSSQITTLQESERQRKKAPCFAHNSTGIKSRLSSICWVFTEFKHAKKIKFLWLRRQEWHQHFKTFHL